MMILGIKPLFFSFIHLSFCYIHFIRCRWNSIFRGMGAPGFISFWLACLVFLLEYSVACGDEAGKLRDLILLAFQLDMALMMLDTGINKIFHGYRTNEGMNYGMVNPAWGYWPNFFRHFKTGNILFHFCNHNAYIFQIAGAACMLIPPLQWLGGAIIAFSFLVVKTMIRLGVLCDQVILMTVIFTKEGGWLHSLLIRLFPALTEVMPEQYSVPGFFNAALTVILWAYIICLPFTKLGMYYNFYGRKRLPEVLQGILERVTNLFGIILWRVFTFELIEYYMRVYFEDRTTGQRVLFSRFGHRQWKGNDRFLWVGESIMSVIVFNTKRYFGDADLFHERILRYARTMPCPKNSIVVFEHVTILPVEGYYRDCPAKEYRVDQRHGQIEEKILDPLVPVYRERTGSPVHVSARPGSYAPKKSH